MPGIKDITHMTQAELALLWDISTRTIQRNAKWETLRHGSGQGSYYVWAECHKAEKAENDGLSQGEEALTDRMRKDKADADMAEMDRDQQAGNLLDGSEVRRIWIAFLGRLKDNLLGLADRCAPEIEDGQTLAERIAVMRRHVNRSLRDVVAELGREEGE